MIRDIKASHMLLEQVMCKQYIHSSAVAICYLTHQKCKRLTCIGIVFSITCVVQFCIFNWLHFQIIKATVSEPKEQL